MGVQPKDLNDFIRAKPFLPFRLTLTDGRTFDIHHPELVMVGRSSAQIGIRSPRYADPVYERVISISLLHVMQIEVVPESDVG